MQNTTSNIRFGYLPPKKKKKLKETNKGPFTKGSIFETFEQNPL